MNDIVIMAWLFVALVLLYAFGYVYTLIRKNLVARKRDLYLQLLHDARATRKQYIKTLEILENSKLKLDTHKEELRSEKARLRTTRTVLREMAKDIRIRQAAASKKDKIEANVIAQKKHVFTEHWKILNNFRCRYNIYLQTFRAVEKEYQKHAKMAADFSRDWEAEKNKLLTMYRELKEVISIADPRISLSVSD